MSSSNYTQGMNMPNHVAIIMDGNGRWAEKQGLPRIDGHRAGLENISKVVESLTQYNISYITIYALSTENWNRPKREINGLLSLLEEHIHKTTHDLHAKKIRLIHIGRTDRLTTNLKKAIEYSTNLTQNNDSLILSIAFDYGGRLEILEAVRNIIRNKIPADKINEILFEQYLYTDNIPYPDLIIRTGGEVRMSNFLLWQSAYSEYFFTPTLWPDLGHLEIKKAVQAYSKRERRFGGLHAQT